MSPLTAQTQIKSYLELTYPLKLMNGIDVIDVLEYNLIPRCQ